MPRPIRGERQATGATTAAPTAGGGTSRPTSARRRFASDLDNLTLATPELNRYQKRDHDAAEWLPARNRCWFAAIIIAVRREYDLTIDRREAAALEAVLKGCDD